MEKEYVSIITWCEQNKDRFPQQLRLSQCEMIIDVPRFINKQILVMQSDNHFKATMHSYEALLMFRQAFYQHKKIEE